MSGDPIVFVTRIEKADPEAFAMVEMNPDRMSIRRTVFYESEDDLWAALHKSGMPDDEIRAKIAAAKSSG